MFDPLLLPNCGISCKFYCTPYLVIIKVGLAKLSFSKHMPIKKYGENQRREEERRVDERRF